MRTLALLILAATLASGESLQTSQGAVVLSNVADSLSSWGGYELNPSLGRGTFGWKQELVKGALISGLLAAENVVVKAHPRDRRALVMFNYVVSSFFSSLAVSNVIRR